MHVSKSICPICEQPANFLAYAVVAPWISELGDAPNSFSTYQRCENCDFNFFSHRYTDTELATIYADYRGGDFFRVRHSWEPWYNNSVNGAFTDDDSATDQITKRRDFMISALERVFPQGSRINGCVDFGGDYGQFFPDNAFEPKILIDLSGKQVPGVVVHKSLDELQEPVDLIMNCNVIEHMTVVNEIINEMKNNISPNGYLYIELPLDRFKVRKFHRSETYRKYLKFLVRHRNMFILTDFLSGLFRQFFGYIPFFGIVKQSEHINYFSKKSIEQLIAKSEASIVYMSPPDFEYRVGHIKQGRISVICN
jgi:hypothetical protein